LLTVVVWWFAASNFGAGTCRYNRSKRNDNNLVVQKMPHGWHSLPSKRHIRWQNFVAYLEGSDLPSQSVLHLRSSSLSFPHKRDDEPFDGLFGILYHSRTPFCNQNMSFEDLACHKHHTRAVFAAACYRYRRQRPRTTFSLNFFLSFTLSNSCKHHSFNQRVHINGP